MLPWKWSECRPEAGGAPAWLILAGPSGPARIGRPCRCCWQARARLQQAPWKGPGGLGAQRAPSQPAVRAGGAESWLSYTFNSKRKYDPPHSYPIPHSYPQSYPIPRVSTALCQKPKTTKPSPTPNVIYPSMFMIVNWIISKLKTKSQTIQTL